MMVAASISEATVTSTGIYGQITQKTAILILCSNLTTPTLPCIVDTGNRPISTFISGRYHTIVQRICLKLALKVLENCSSRER
jgi:hypothetical protein